MKEEYRKMKRRSGSTIGSVVLALAGLLAVGAAGYSFLSGNTLCALFTCDTDTKVAAVSTTGSGDTCCPLSHVATTNVAEKSECSDVKVTNVAASDCAAKSECGVKTTNVAASECATKADCGVKTTNVAASECATKSDCGVKATNVAASECATKADCGVKT
ncbi:MAG: hypothetical protein EA376_04425, partial [Phycisphaeraceae bacterium]